MSFTSEPKTSDKKLDTIVKELNTLSSILESVQQSKAHLNAPKRPVSNNYPSHSQNYRAPMFRTFPTNPRPMYYNQFPIFPNRPTHAHNNFSRASRNDPRLPFTSQPQAKSNKFTFVASKAVPLMTKSNLSAQCVTKSPMVLSNVNRSVQKPIDNETKASFAQRLAHLKSTLEKKTSKKNMIASVTMQNKTPNVNIAQPIGNKTFIIPSSVPDHRSSNARDTVPVNSTNIYVIPNIPKDIITPKVQLSSESTLRSNTLRNRAICPSIAENVVSSSSDSKSAIGCLPKSVENNLSLAANNVRTVILKQANKTGSKEANGSSKPIPSPQYKIGNRNFPLFARANPTSSKESDSLRNLHTRVLKINSNLTINRAGSESSFKKLEKQKALLLFKKKSPVKPRKLINSKFKVVYKNRTPAQITSPPSWKVGKLALNKYKVINRHKSPIRTLTVKRGLLPKEVPKFNSKYRIVNKRKSSPKTSVEFEVMSSSDGGQENENNNIKAVNGSLAQKISQLKYIKTTGYEGYDLTSFSPEELVAMDTSSLLQLSDMLKSTKRKQPPLIKMSKYKLVSKESRTKQKAARMVKAKYQNQGRRNSPRSWNVNRSTGTYKATGYYSPLKNGYRKAAGSRTPKFRRTLSKCNRFKKTNFAVVGNIHYRVSRTKMTKLSRKSLILKHATSKKTAKIIVVRGERFRMDPSGKSLKKLSSGPSKLPLKRINLCGRTYVSTGHDVLTQTTGSQVRNLASRVLHRSIQRVWASAAKKEELKKSNVCCMFFNRFGKCNRGTSCPYSHDPSKIAVCTRFLRGTCKDKNCLFSHERAPGKMAICSFFLQGLCTTTECPYRHELLSPDAKLCKAFVRGYCSLGMKCQKAHILICPDHFRGHCEKGTFCAYPHPPQPKRKEDNIKLETLDIHLFYTLNTRPCSEKVHEESALSNEESSDEEVTRYFDSVKSFKSTEASCRKQKKTWSVEEKIKKCKSLHCRPKRDKLLNCPTFIPLSLDDDS